MEVCNMIRINRKLKYRLFFIMLAVIMSGYVCSAITTPAYALPKIYQDIINQKKKERAEKKKEEKKESKDKEKENKEEDNDEPERGMNPIVREPDLDPYIAIHNLKLINTSGNNDGYFGMNDRVDLEISYKIGDYEGFDDVHISWSVKDQSGNWVHHDSRTVRLRPDRYVTERISNAVPMNKLHNSSEFSVEVMLEVENKTARKTIWNKTRGVSGKVRIRDAYLTTERSHNSYYPGYPASIFYTGDPFWIVIEYEVTGDARGDVEFECTIDTRYNFILFRDHFRSTAQKGYRTVCHQGWLPDYLPSSTYRMTLNVKAKHGNSTTSTSSSYTIKSSSEKGYSYRDDWDYDYERDFCLSSVITSSRPDDWLRKRYFDGSDSIFLIAKYNVHRGFNEFVTLLWKVYDSQEELIYTDEARYMSSADGFFPIKLEFPHSLQSGRYSYSVSVKNKPNKSTRKGSFTISNYPSPVGMAKLGDIAGTDIVIRDPDNQTITFEIDNRLTMSVPDEWDAMFHYDNNLPPFTFLPTPEITGMVMVSEFKNVDTSHVETSFDDAVKQYEQLESKATKIADSTERKEIIIDSRQSLICSYKGSIKHRGEYLNEYIENVDILVIQIWYPTDDANYLYSVRLITPEEHSDLLFDVAEKVIDMIQIN